jgi:arabinofuranan 3-O-arabinosyltransferase
MADDSDTGRAAGARRLLLTIAVLTLALYIPYYAATLTLTGGIPRDGTGLVVGRDFLNIWMYGRAAFGADPARYYDIPTYWHALEGVVGPRYPGQQWSYPPIMLLAAAPFGLLPYLAALTVWTMLGLAAFVAALRLWTRDWRLILPLCAAPAAVFGMMSGQFAFFAAALVLAVLRWRESRPWLAGILLGLLSVKPQLGLLFPVLFLVTRNGRAFLAAGLTVLALAAVTAGLWGVGIWRVYLLSGIANQSLILSDPEHLAGPFMPTLFMNLRMAGASLGVAEIGQAMLSALALLLAAATFLRRPPAGDLRANLTFAACAVSCTPYMLSYDTLALAVFAALLMERGTAPRAMLILILLPFLQMAAAGFSLPGVALLPLGAALLLHRRPAAARAPEAIATAA